jgi:hypothetical protein
MTLHEHSISISCTNKIPRIAGSLPVTLGDSSFDYPVSASYATFLISWFLEKRYAAIIKNAAAKATITGGLH